VLPDFELSRAVDFLGGRQDRDLELEVPELFTGNGREALVLEMGGENPVQKEKAKSRIYLIKKGNRIVSFVCTQWRPLNGTFSDEPFGHFEAFLQSFRFLTKDFYEQLEEEMTKAGL
jgi:hypothetical protein